MNGSRKAYEEAEGNPSYSLIGHSGSKRWISEPLAWISGSLIWLRACKLRAEC